MDIILANQCVTGQPEALMNTFASKFPADYFSVDEFDNYNVGFFSNSGFGPSPPQDPPVSEASARARGPNSELGPLLPTMSISAVLLTFMQSIITKPVEFGMRMQALVSLGKALNRDLAIPAFISLCFGGNPKAQDSNGPIVDSYGLYLAVVFSEQNNRN